jgi:hypothetical protein
VKKYKLAALRFFALLFLLPGLACLVANASLTTHYFDTVSREPVPDDDRTVPRELNGVVVYLTEGENTQLNQLRYYGMRVFGIGCALGLIYLGYMATHLEQGRSSEEDED